MGIELKQLSVRHEKFCEGIAAGLTHSKAYLQAGWVVSEKTAAERGCQLSKNIKIKAKIAELRKPQTEAAVMTKDFKRKKLREIVMAKTSTWDNKIRAIAEDNRMGGHYEADRTEIDIGPKTLLSIKERAAQVALGLARKYETPE